MTFDERSGRAVRNPRLQQSIFQATDLLYTLRRGRFDELAAAGDAYRTRARAIRERTIGRIDHYARQFTEAARRRGIEVHFASDAAEARTIGLSIARECGARRIIKMKSMLTEEIELREAFTEAGMPTVETDLGEWILQLSGEKPSHLIAPALHKSKEEIKALFDHHIGPHDSLEPKALVDRAQVALREEFLAGDLGVTGVNFAVAETGTLVLVCNEGNGRLVTSGPSVYLAFVPVEKLVPTLDDTATLVKMLVQSATGQRLTAFVSWLTGPRLEGELDGPGAVHVVLVDNGRSASLGGPLEEALMCIRCGACLNACPVYRRVGGHSYGGVYPGPIGIAVTPIVEGAGPHGDELAHASSLCGACEDVCPVKIDLPRLILQHRRTQVTSGRAPAKANALFSLYAMVMQRPWLYRLALFVGWIATSIIGRRGRVEWLPGAAAWTRSRSMPIVARESFSQRFARRRRQRGR